MTQRLLGMPKRKGLSYSSAHNGSDTGDTTEDDTSLISDSDSSTRKYVLTESAPKLSLCKPQRLTRNERFCLIGGAIVFVVIALLFIIIAVVAATSSGSSSESENTDQEPWKNVRLPRAIIPEVYQISLTVNLPDSFDVQGEVNITATTTTKTKYILIHAKDMNITRTHVIQGGNEIALKKTFFYSENDFYVIELSKALKTAPLSIHLVFNYTLRDNLVGFYRSSYVTSTNETRHLATTQFEPTNARAAFPCFDEPAFKANFTTQITHNEQYMAVSNMPEDTSRSSTSRKRDDSTVTTCFQTSVEMSTYLVAFVVSDFRCRNGTAGDGRIEVNLISVLLVVLGLDNISIIIIIMLIRPTRHAFGPFGAFDSRNM